MQKFALMLVAFVFLSSTCTATHSSRNVFIKHNAPPPFPNPFAFPPPPPPATSFRYDIKYNPLKFGFAPPAPVPAIPGYTVPISVAAAYPVAAYPVPHPLAAYQPVPAYLPPEYAAAHAHQFIARHFAHGHHH